MRLKSEIWAQAYIRRCFGNGAAAVVVRRGQRDGGAIFIKVNSLDGHVALYGPAPAGLEAGGGRLWSRCLGDEKVSEAEADGYLQRQTAFDPDIWIIEVEDMHGRHFLNGDLTDD